MTYPWVVVPQIKLEVSHYEGSPKKAPYCPRLAAGKLSLI